jgi:hypothetical protein
VLSLDAAGLIADGLPDDPSGSDMQAVMARYVATLLEFVLADLERLVSGYDSPPSIPQTR